MLVEAGMTAKVENRKLKPVVRVGEGKECFAFGFNLALSVTFVCLLCLSLMNVGCNDRQTTVPAGPQIPVSPEARKAELINSLERKFENPQAHYELARLYHAEGLWEKAEYHYNVALGFDPALAEAKAAMVKLFLDSGDSAKSKSYADDYMNKAASSAMQSLRLGVAFHRQQLEGYALDAYQQALSLAPGSAEVNKQMGLYYLDKGDKTLAKEYLIRSFNIDPKQPDVAGELGRLGVEVRIPGQEEEPAEKSSQTPGT